MDKNKLTNAIKTSYSIKETLTKVGLAPIGGNYGTFHRYVKRWNINTSHFKKPQSFKKTDYGRMFIKNSKATRSTTKKEIISKNLIPYKCSICGLSKWLNENISLHLDHINGVRDDNRLKNLRFLCPNCHSMTPTYCGRALKKPDKHCFDCRIKIYHTSTRCLSCANKMRSRKGYPKINWPSVKELQRRLKACSFSALGRELGVSDNAIRKHIKTNSQ